MSTRPKRARKVSSKPNYSQQVELDLSGTSSDESDQQVKGTVSKSRRKKGGLKKSEKKGEEVDSKEKKGKGRKGKAIKVDKVKVNPLGHLPFELVSEILSQLTPKDLLNFARTNKQYRSILMSKNRSNSIWKTSRRRIQLPDLTAQDLSEPAYAALVFGVHCECCGRKAQACGDWWLRQRICTDCRRPSYVRFNSKLRRERGLHKFTLGCVITTRYGSSMDSPDCYTFTLGSEIDHYDNLLKTMEEDDEINLDAARPKRSHRQSNSSSGAQSTSNGEDGDGQLDEEGVEVGKRVITFVENRQELLRRIATDGDAIRSVVYRIVKEVKEEEVRLQMLAKDSSSTDAAVQELQKSIKIRLDRIEGYSKDELALSHPSQLII